jgi:HD-GYP domain-containing protein (c-di-GMP phosphodiesterase class II)
VGTLPWPARAYIGVLACLAAWAIAHAVSTGPPWRDVVVLAALYVFFSSIALGTAATTPVTQTLASAIAFGSFMIVGPWAAAMVGTASGLVIRREALAKRIFNASQGALSALAGGLTYSGLRTTLHVGIDEFPGILLVALAANVVYLVVNGSLLTGILVLTKSAPLRPLFRRTILRGIVPSLGYGLFGVLMAVLWVVVGLGLAAVLLVLLPLFVARWAFAQYAVQQASYDAAIRTLVQAVETKDYYTRGHSERVRRGALMMAKDLRMQDDRATALGYASILHDVGKLGLPTRLLQKSGPLTPNEYGTVQLHPVRGLEIVREIAFLHEAQAGIVHHHERLDGTGYPMGLRGTDIPEFARIIAVADAFDSMTSTRSYRQARTVDEAAAELVACAGTHFDPQFVEVFLTAVARVGWELAEPLEVPEGAPTAAYDHDDPTRGVPVLGPDGPRAEGAR